jgi:hypothetical protein
METEPQAKSPDHIPQSAVLEKSPLSNAIISSSIMNSRKFKEAEPSPRNPLKPNIGFGQPIRKLDLLSNEVSFTGKQSNPCSNFALSPRETSMMQQLEGQGNVVVFDKKQMKQFLLGVWDQMSSHLGTISSLQKKLDATQESLDFGKMFKKNKSKSKQKTRTNMYGVPVYERSSSKKKQKLISKRLFQKRRTRNDSMESLDNLSGTNQINEITFRFFRIERS